MPKLSLILGLVAMAKVEFFIPLTDMTTELGATKTFRNYLKMVFFGQLMMKHEQLMRH